MVDSIVPPFIDEFQQTPLLLEQLLPLVSCLALDEKESHLPLISSPRSSFGDLVDIIFSTQYTQLNPHLFDVVPVQEFM